VNPNALDLPFGMQPADLATLLAGLAALAVFVAIWAGTTVRDPMRARVKALQAQREELKAGVVTPRRRQAAKQAQRIDTMRDILKKLAVLQEEQTKAAQDKLIKAGYRSRDGVVIYLFARLLGPPLMGIAITLLFMSDAFMAEAAVTTKAMVAIVIVFLGYSGPDIYLKNQATKRVAAIRKGLPDALDLMVICSEAGLTIEATFNRVARELGASYPEMSDELTLTAIELGFLSDRRQGLENLSKRVDLQAVRAVVTTLIQTEKYGTPLAASLRVLSAEFRNERMMKAEEKAARLPAIMTIPLILFILPTLFIVLLGPAACQINDTLIKD
jgi:tight adherence protein C